jgi:hypothetical protein
MPNGRCRIHGGKSKPPAKGSQHALKHGLYAAYLTPEELAKWDNIELGKVDAELRLCRIRLERALKLEMDSTGALELEQTVESPVVVNGIPIGNIEGDPDGEEAKIVTKTYKRRDFSGPINTLMGRIESLEKTRAELMKAAPPEPDDGDVIPEDYVVRSDEAGPAKPVL